MKAVLRRGRDRLREIFGPPPERFDTLDQRLDAVDRQLRELQDLLQVIVARSEAAGERSTIAVETAARTRARLEELEQALGRR